MYIPMIEKFYDYEMNRRKRFDIFDYWQLAQPMRFYSEEPTQNYMYGHERIIKNYFRIPQQQKLNTTIEHGLWPAGILCWETRIKHIHSICTFGKKRKRFLQETYPNKKVYNIGPYIKLAENLYQQEQLDAIKKRYGKILLVFPSHSIAYEESQNNLKSMIEEIEKIKAIHRFDSVFVCLYWKDILLEKFNIYKRNKYTIVTAGHACDGYFLNRLKSIISLADVTMTNDWGTHAAYITHMDKPLYFYEKNIVEIKRDKQWTDIYRAPFFKAKMNELRIAWQEQFGEYCEALTEQQREFITEYDAEDEVRLGE